MISEMDREDLVGLGARFRAAHLAEQATYTLELASHDGKALDRLLPSGYIGEVRRALESVLGGMSFPGVAASEAREAAEASSRELRSARSWRRTVARRAIRARALGRDVPEHLARVSAIDSAAAVAMQVSSMVAWMEDDAGLLPGEDVPSLVKEGKELAAKLHNGKTGELAARLAQLPATDRRFCEEKGALFVALHIIHDAARELHSGDRESANRYNLSILSRRTASARP